MEPFELKRLGRSDLMLPRLGFGAAGLGSTEVSETQASSTVETAWETGVRFYDTSPWYGRGLSERRIGTVLASKPRDELILSTKVGRIFVAPANIRAFRSSDRFAPTALPFDYYHDYSYEGVMRSYEDSLQRLGMNRVDMLIIHDLDRTSFGTDALVQAHLAQLATGGIRALKELKQTGRVQAIGAGVNRIGTIPLFLECLELDFFLVALPYTLAEQPALDREFPLCEEKAVGIIVGAPLASGILATGPVPGARYNYHEPTSEESERVRRMEEVCRDHEISLAAAALQFPLHHPLVASVIPGGVEPAHPSRNHSDMLRDIPVAFWAELKARGLLRADAPVPSR
ncbi:MULTISPECIES: aldo/keto reductase [unclassified Devosia]|uniref:aldo/keto reductase n=1 Tax=unclassified Devosia TaxID=196773 RepID=UPI001555ADB0|nr:MULTISPECIES: aldo/keto reductase [unclassified Devosia]